MNNHIENPSFKPSDYPKLHFEDAAWNWFATACQDFELECDDDKRMILEQLYSHLLGVNTWMNLTRLTSAADYLKFHILDSLTILNLIDELTKDNETTKESPIVFDLGSGGGYPGLPLMTWRPDLHFVLCDSRQKKVEFLKEALKLTGCKQAEACAFRGREVRHHRPDLFGRCDIVVSRAAGKAAELLADAAELLMRGGAFIIMKGQNFERDEGEDFARACKAYRFEMLEILPVALDENDPDRNVILAVKK